MVRKKVEDNFKLLEKALMELIGMIKIYERNFNERSYLNLKIRSHLDKMLLLGKKIKDEVLEHVERINMDVCLLLEDPDNTEIASKIIRDATILKNDLWEL